MKYLHKNNRSSSSNSCSSCNEERQRKRKKESHVDWLSSLTISAEKVWASGHRECLERLLAQPKLQLQSIAHEAPFCDTEKQCFCARLQARVSLSFSLCCLHAVLSLLLCWLLRYKSMLNCWLRSNLYHFGPHSKWCARVCTSDTMQVAINWPATVARDCQHSPSNDHNSHAAALIYWILSCTFINWLCENEFIYEKKREKECPQTLSISANKSWFVSKRGLKWRDLFIELPNGRSSSWHKVLWFKQSSLLFVIEV